MELKKILIVDDDRDFGEMLKEALGRAGFDAALQINGELAVEALQEKAYDLVVSDIKMPKMTGLQLLEWIKTNQPELRCILISGFTEFKDNIDAAMLGCKKFLFKPFSPDDFLKAVKGALRKVTKADFDLSQFACIESSEFLPTQNCDYPLYVLLPTQQFLQIASPGDPLLAEHIEALATRGLFNLWMPKEYFEKMSAQSANQISKAVEAQENDKLSAQSKVKPIFIKQACELATENLRLMKLDETSIVTAVKTFESSIKLLMSESFTNTEIQQFLRNISTHTYSISVTVSVLAVYVLKVMGWSSPKNAQGVVLGAFLRDIGLYRLPPEVREKKPHKMTKEELALYRSHPEVSLKVIEGLKNANDITRKIVLQHHEKPDGSGFPKGLLRSDISPLARLVYLIDSFVCTWTDLQEKQKANDPVAILKTMDKKQPLTFERSDVIALEFALSEATLKAAQLKYQKYVAC